MPKRFAQKTAEPLRWKKLSMPRLGVGYRFGADLAAWRFVLGIPVPSLKR